MPDEKQNHTAKKIISEYFFVIPIITSCIVTAFIACFFVNSVLPIAREVKYCSECGVEHAIGGSCVETELCPGCNKKGDGFTSVISVKNVIRFTI